MKRSLNVLARGRSSLMIGVVRPGGVSERLWPDRDCDRIAKFGRQFRVTGRDDREGGFGSQGRGYDIPPSASEATDGRRQEVALIDVQFALFPSVCLS